MNNDLYRGQVIWNRCQWVRLATDSCKRRVVVNPEAQWVQHSDESLRIVSNELWTAVKRRQNEQHRLIGQRVARGIKSTSAKLTGRVGRYLFSGLLRCSECGSNYTMSNGTKYACAGYINGRVCKNDRYVRKDTLERALLADIRAGLLDPEVMREIERRVRQAARGQRKDDSHKKIAQLEAEGLHIITAIGQGMLSPALRQRLQEAETEVERLRKAPKPASIEAMLPQLPGVIRGHIENLPQLAEQEPVRARMAVRQALDTDLITIRPAEAGRGVIAEFGLAPVQLLTGTSSEIMVAGAGFEPATFGL